MLTGLHVGNLRLFDGDGWDFPIAPLTVICGTNSSGKSTLVKAPLLLKQSQSFGQGAKWPAGHLRFTGEEVDLGNYRTLISHEDTERDLTLGLTIEDRMPPEVLEGIGHRPGDWVVARKPRPAFVPYTLTASFVFHGVRSEDSPVTRSQRDSQRPGRLNARLRSALFVVDAEGLQLQWEVREPAGPELAEYTIEFPRSLLTPMGIERYLEMKLSSSQTVTLGVRLSGNLPSQVQGTVKASEAKHFGSILSFPLPPLIDGATDDLSSALARLYYLGPLRAPAKRYYVAGSDVLPSLDATGEFLPYVLRDRLDSDVTCVEPSLSKGPVSISLGRALDEWLQYLRSGDPDRDQGGSEVRVDATRDVLVELQIKGLDGDELHGIADSGFGYSQALPILVRCLLAESGSTVFVEQPELHLNPALQVRLAAFFVACVLAGRQIVIETHSEHIVNAIRVLTAEGVAPDIAGKVRILFLDGQGSPVVHDLSIQPDGTVPEWPRSFFGEALSLSGRLLAAQRRFLKG